MATPAQNETVTTTAPTPAAGTQPSSLLSSSVPLAPSGSTTQTVLPEWYTNYAQDILSRQAAVAATPYPTYQGPRVADFTANQQAGFDMTQQAATAGQGAVSDALSATQGHTWPIQPRSRPAVPRAGWSPVWHRSGHAEPPDWREPLAAEHAGRWLTGRAALPDERLKHVCGKHRPIHEPLPAAGR